MAKIKLTIINENAQATLIEGPLAAKNANTEVDVSVSGEMWEGLGLKLVASCNGVDRDAPIIDGKALVPWECMIAGYHLNVGIQGGDGENPSIYTVYGDAGVVLRSTGNAKIDQALQPTPSLADKIMAAFNNVLIAWSEARTKINLIWDDYQNGLFKGDRGQPGPPGIQGPPGRDGADAPPYDDTEIKEELVLMRLTKMKH